MATLTIRLPDSQRERLAAMAARRGVSLNKPIQKFAARALDEHDTKLRSWACADSGVPECGIAVLEEFDQGHERAGNC